MKVSNPQWKERLAAAMPTELAREVDIFETEMELRREGKIDERVFAETRLRRGVYGQRYDNGQRHDGVATQTLPFPSGELTKGPNTMWDALGMQRIKIPYGGMNAEQLEVMAELAEEYSDGIAHVTTRQDFQLHFIHIEDTPALMRRLAAAGITTREACGNSVRNVTACPYAGVCTDEPFDVTPYAKALATFLLGHPDCQDFGRKFKPAFSGCAQHACGLTNMHDLGVTAVTRNEGGEEKRGFELYVGGGLGAVPHQAKLYDDFLPPEELLPTAQAIARVFAQHGEKKNRNRARIKFLVKDLGIDKFRELVRAEREKLTPDPRWTSLIDDALAEEEQPLNPPGDLPASDDPAFGRWVRANVRAQRQEGYSVATVALPLGDITPHQLRALADIVRRFNKETVRTTVEQNIVLRWVSNAELPALHAALQAVGLAEPGAGNITDIVSCPGTDTCKLGISSSRGLAAELRQRLAETSYNLDAAVENLHIKVSGCFNSCGQHHVADLGFYGVTRKFGGFQVPHFQVVLGGQWEQNGGAFGLPILPIPSKRIPEVVERLTTRFVTEREAGDTFQDWVKRVGKADIKAMLQDLAGPPADPNDTDFFTDWSDARLYSTGDMGIGECAGEVVPPVEFHLSAAERGVFEAQVALEAGEVGKAHSGAYEAMLSAAKGLLTTELRDVAPDGDTIVSAFRERFYDTRKFFDPYAGGKFAHYLFAAHEKQGHGNGAGNGNGNGAAHGNGHGALSAEAVHHLIEEAQLFVEAAYSCYNRLDSGAAA